MRELSDLTADIQALAARARAGDRSPELARAIEDLLCDGYAACLQTDSRVRRLDRRRRALAAQGGHGDFDEEIREIDRCRAFLENSATEARRRLAALRECFVSIGGLRAAVR